MDGRGGLWWYVRRFIQGFSEERRGMLWVSLGLLSFSLRDAAEISSAGAWKGHFVECESHNGDCVA